MKLQELIDYHRKELTGITWHVATHKYSGIQKLAFDAMIKRHEEAIKLLEDVKVYSDWMLHETNEPESKPDITSAQIMSAMLETIFGDRVGPDDHALAMSRPVGVTPDDWKRINTPLDERVHGRFDATIPPDHPRFGCVKEPVVDPEIVLDAMVPLNEEVRREIHRLNGRVWGQDVSFPDESAMGAFHSFLILRGYVSMEIVKTCGVKMTEDDTIHEVAVGQEWVRYDMRYRVEWIKDGRVGLSLPGSSQVIRTVAMDLLQREWNLLGSRL